MPRGGKRPGAGKPKGYKHKQTLAKATSREHFVKRIEAEWDPLIDAELEVAKGRTIMLARAFETAKDGTVRRTGKFERVTNPAEMAELLNKGESGEDYYRLVAVPADSRMLIELNARIMGKVAEQVTHTGADGGPIEIHHHYSA